MKYHLTYRIEQRPDGLDASQVPEGHGACTALFVAALVMPSAHTISVQFYGVDGRDNTQLPAVTQFKLWALLAASLAQDPNLEPTYRALCMAVLSELDGAKQEATPEPGPAN